MSDSIDRALSSCTDRRLSVRTLWKMLLSQSKLLKLNGIVSNIFTAVKRNFKKILNCRLQVQTIEAVGVGKVVKIIPKPRFIGGDAFFQTPLLV